MKLSEIRKIYFSKIEEGRMEILPTQYELSSLGGDVSNMIRERARKKGLSFEIDVDSNIPYVLYGDDIRIRQIALNLPSIFFLRDLQN